MKKLNSTKASNLLKGSPNSKFTVTKNLPKIQSQEIKIISNKKYNSNGFLPKFNQGSKITQTHLKRSFSTTSFASSKDHLHNTRIKNNAISFNKNSFLSHRSFCSGNSFQAVVPLPNNNFSLFSIPRNQPIQNFVDNLKTEDPSIIDVAVLNAQGQRMSTTNSLETVEDGFKTQINGKDLQLTTTFGADANGTFSARKWNIASLSSSGLALDQQNSRLLELKKEIYPLWEKKQELDDKATRTANLVAVGTLGYLGAQFTTLAYLTWWTFNWDIMEPVTYFITFSTGIVGYIYFLLTKRDYTYPDAYEGIITGQQRKRYNSTEGFDVDRYFALEHEIRKIQPLALLEIPDEVQQLKQNETQGESN